MTIRAKKFAFKAKIFKVGINACVKVPARVTSSMTAVKGYIPVKGTIRKHRFVQTLVPVRGQGYRLYVNLIMLRGSGLEVGDVAEFSIAQDFAPRVISMPETFKLKLKELELEPEFKRLSAFRQKEILRYLNHLKTREAFDRVMAKVISGLENSRGKSEYKFYR